jgi:hypothetical protein
MDRGTEEITREYRLHFNDDEALWEEPIPPEITSNVLAGRVAASAINRTSLLAWCLMNIPSVEVADLTGGGWIEIRISTGPNFDEESFKAEVAGIVTRVKNVPTVCAAQKLSFRSRPAAHTALTGQLPGATETTAPVSA